MRILITIALASLISGCSLIPQDGGDSPDAEQVLKQHATILSAITTYVAKLQEMGVLPKPEDIKAQEEAAKGEVQ